MSLKNLKKIRKEFDRREEKEKFEIYQQMGILMHRLSEIENDGLSDLEFDTLDEWADYYSPKKVITRCAKENKDLYIYKKNTE